MEFLLFIAVCMFGFMILSKMDYVRLLGGMPGSIIERFLCRSSQARERKLLRRTA